MLEVQKRKNLLNLKNVNSHPSPVDSCGDHYKLRDKLFPVLRPRGGGLGALKWVNENGTVSIFDFSL